MGETTTRKMIGSRTFLFTILAVSCHGLPKITGEVVPEAQTMLLQHTAAFTEMSPTAFISAMASSGGSETDCRDFATKTTTDISTTVTSTQKMLDDVDTGSSCAAMGQDAVTTATAAVTAAKAELETAKTDKATKQSAKVAACSATFQLAAFNLGSFKNGQLDKACVDISGMVGYTTADAACTTATTISTAADQAVVTATTKVTDAEASLATDVKEASKLKRACLCRVKAAQTEAWTAASTTIASHAADWKQAHEIVCALDKSTTCTVPACPAVTKPAVAAGVANAPKCKVISQYAVTGAALNSDPTPSSLGVTWIVSGTSNGASFGYGPSLGATCNAVCATQSGSSCVREGFRAVALQSSCAFQKAALASVLPSSQAKNVADGPCELCGGPKDSSSAYCLPGTKAYSYKHFYSSSWSDAKSYTCQTRIDGRSWQALCPCEPHSLGQYSTAARLKAAAWSG